jgi:hypothetical protein
MTKALPEKPMKVTLFAISKIEIEIDDEDAALIRDQYHAEEGEGLLDEIIENYDSGTPEVIAVFTIDDVTYILGVNESNLSVAEVVAKELLENLASTTEESE